MKKMLVFSCCFMLVVSIVIGVAQRPCLAESEKTVTLGMMGTFTGPFGPMGMVSKCGALLAQKHINETGFVVGGQKYKIAFSEWDTRTDPKMAVAGINKLMDQDNVKVIIGPIISGSALALQPITQPKGVITMCYSSAENIIRPGITYTFRGSVDNRMMAAAPATYWRAMGTQTLCFIIENEAGPLTAEKDTHEIFEKMGGKVLATEFFETGTTDFTTQLIKLKAKNPDALYVAASPEAAGLIIKQTREIGWPVQTFGNGSPPTGPAFWEIGGQAIEGHIDPTAMRGVDLGPEAHKLFGYDLERRKRFFKEFQETYKIDPNFSVAQFWYDFVFLVVEAMKAAGSVDDTAKIREALVNIDYPGATFRWRFFPSGQCHVFMGMSKIHAGKGGWTTVAICTPADSKDPKATKWDIHPLEPVENIKDIRKQRGY